MSRTDADACDLAATLVLDSDVRAELARMKVQLALIDRLVEQSIEHGSAIGGELRLALRIQAIREHKL